MPPVRILTQTVGLLMAAWKECGPFDPDFTPMNYGTFCCSNGERVALSVEGKENVGRAIEKCAPYLDQYPISTLETMLRQIVGEARSTLSNPSEVSTLLRERLSQFFDKLEAPVEWEVVMAVTGLSFGQQAFRLGRCQFYVMDDMEFRRWGQREATGLYDPPPTAIPYLRQTLDENILGNWVASIRVEAVDCDHARNKGRFQLEETLNTLRYGGLFLGRAHNCPRSGLGKITFWNNHSLCIQVNPPVPYGNSTFTDGAEGASVKFCEHAPAWKEVVALLGKANAERTEIELLVTNALEWVGQAAAAPRTPVRLVCLVTALEVLVMGSHESLGKRSKLSKRVGRIVADMHPGKGHPIQQMDHLYRLRSECLHDGATQIDVRDASLAYQFVAFVIQAYLSKQPYCNMSKLSEVLTHLEPQLPFSYEI